MPTLSATFQLFDRFSSYATKITKSADAASEKMLDTSKSADKVNGSIQLAGVGFDKASKSANKMSRGLGMTAANSDKANNSLKRLIGTIASMAAIKKGIDITDDYINSTARLRMVNDGTQTTDELQQKVFDAAGRSRGSYTDMASAVSKMNLLAGDSFSGNDEAIKFTELLQKSLKVSGAGTSEQQSAFLQLTQAMAAGKLQGDEFRSIMENAPMVADAIAKHMGKSKGELKDLSSKGLITADIIKEAMFKAGDDIEEKFAEMPMTFSDIGISMSNKMMQSFAPVMEKINGMINSNGMRRVLNGFSSGIEMVAQGFNQLLDAIQQGDPIVKAFFTTAIIMTAAWATGMLIAAAASLAAAWPLLLIVGIIAVIILGLNQMGVTFAEIFEIAGGIIGGFYAVVYNIIAGIWNIFVSIAEFIANVFNDPLGAIVNLFVNMALSVMGILKSIAKAIDDLFGTSFASKINEKMAMLQYVGNNAKSENYKSLDDMRMGTKDIMGTSFDWSQKGREMGSFIDDWDFGGLEDMAGDGFATQSNPATIKGIGKNGNVEVNMADEDIQFMRDLAQRDYIAKIANNTLAPNIKVEFTGQITRDVDLDSLGDKVGAILKDELERAPEGVH